MPLVVVKEISKTVLPIINLILILYIVYIKGWININLSFILHTVKHMCSNLEKGNR